jgi:hypothetical protein
MAGSHNTTVNGKRVRSMTFNSWRGMIGRCRHPSHPHGATYAPLGVCPRWEHGADGKTGFECFLEDMGERPSRRHTLERRKNELGYHKINCEWATLERQARNRSCTKMVDYQGQRMALADAVERSGTKMKYNSILWWLWKGKSFDDLLLMPDVRPARKRRKKNAA